MPQMQDDRILHMEGTEKTVKRRYRKRKKPPQVEKTVAPQYGSRMVMMKYLLTVLVIQKMKVHGR